MYARHIIRNIKESLADTPVLFLRGARQTGKTTLMRDVLRRYVNARYVTLDNAAMLSAALADAAGFLAGSRTEFSAGDLAGSRLGIQPLIIDEAQKVPGLFPAIKELVDRERMPGGFILTGSANVMAGQKVADSLAGRMETFTLWPLAKAELENSEANAVDRLFAERMDWGMASGADMVRAVAVGGYPEAVARTSPRRRAAWFESYVSAIVERDVRDLANIQDVGAVAALLRLLATRAGQLLSYADLSRSLGLPQTTLKRYMALLRQTFLIWELPAWSANLGRRLTKAPKLMFTDTGLATALLGQDEKGLATERGQLGNLLENYVTAEVAKQAAWAQTRVALHHLRAYAGQEVDLILEDCRGRMVGVEVKATATPRSDDFKGLKLLAEAFPDRFVRGVVLHLGREAIPFDRGLWALPAAGL